MEREVERTRDRVPRPSPYFRRRAWLAFQRALDPLAPPKPLRGRRQVISGEVETGYADRHARPLDAQGSV